jgi:hypothetical protein
MPAVKISASSPPKEPAREQISRMVRWTKNSIASAAFGLSLASSYRTSLLMPEMPRRPDFL